MHQVPKGTYRARIILKKGWILNNRDEDSTFTIATEGVTGVRWMDFMLTKDGLKGDPKTENLNGDCDDINYTLKAPPATPSPSPTPVPTPTTSPTPQPTLQPSSSPVPMHQFRFFEKFYTRLVKYLQSVHLLN